MTQLSPRYHHKPANARTQPAQQNICERAELVDTVGTASETAPGDTPGRHSALRAESHMSEQKTGSHSGLTWLNLRGRAATLSFHITCRSAVLAHRREDGLDFLLDAN